MPCMSTSDSTTGKGMELLLCCSLGLGSGLVLPQPDSYNNETNTGSASPGKWCCESRCGPMLWSAMPKMTRICSFGVNHHKWWFMVANTSNESLTCFNADPRITLPKYCTRQVHYYNTTQSTLFHQFLRLIIFSLVVLTPGILAFLNPFDTYSLLLF